ncbi:MAG: TraR/DksA family transcriptional regulator [Desulfurivibrionaceae bacterium]|nr:TraR/DksA family transcriptional regulator [Desulfurivibrionaceae bacterium]
MTYFKKCLEERLAGIMDGQEAKKGKAPVELDQARVGRLSRMDAMQQHAISQAAYNLADLERQRIQSALGRMLADEYGYCVICGEEIAEGRLRFDPSALTCISCAQRRKRDNSTFPSQGTGLINTGTHPTATTGMF